MPNGTITIPGDEEHSVSLTNRVLIFFPLSVLQSFWVVVK